MRGTKFTVWSLSLRTQIALLILLTFSLGGGVIYRLVSRPVAGRVSSGTVLGNGESFTTMFLFQDDSQRLNYSTWSNQSPTGIGSLFKWLCLGYSISESCSDTPLHPFAKVAERANIILSFPKETDRKVIEQSYHVKTRGEYFRN